MVPRDGFEYNTGKREKILSMLSVSLTVLYLGCLFHYLPLFQAEELSYCNISLGRGGYFNPIIILVAHFVLPPFPVIFFILFFLQHIFSLNNLFLIFLGIMSRTINMYDLAINLYEDIISAVLFSILSLMTKSLVFC